MLPAPTILLAKGFLHLILLGCREVNVQRDPSLNPENQTTKAQRHEEVRSQLGVFFVSL